MDPATRRAEWLARLAGVAAGVATIYFVPAAYEPLAWLVLIAALVALAVRIPTRRPAANGVVLGMQAGAAVTLVHLLFVDDYVATHAEEIAALQDHLLLGSLRLTLLAMAPLYWAVLAVLVAGVAEAWRWMVGRSQPR
jgi:hypothetical protein